jgi:hypothetical protein
MSMVSMSELMVVVSADTMDLAASPSSYSPP